MGLFILTTHIDRIVETATHNPGEEICINYKYNMANSKLRAKSNLNIKILSITGV